MIWAESGFSGLEIVENSMEIIFLNGLDIGMKNFVWGEGSSDSKK